MTDSESTNRFLSTAEFLGYRILPVLARVREGFSVRFGCDVVNDTFEVPSPS